MMRQIENSFLFILTFFFSLVCCAQKNKYAEVDNELHKLAQAKKFNGSVLVARGGKILYQKNIGLADIEHQVPITTSTKFELASISKTFTALLILQLADRGKVKLDGKVSDYIPEFRRSDSGEITIQHLLSHTSGLQDFVGLNCSFEQWTEKEFLDGLSKTPISFKAGTKFRYSSSTYILLRYIIERVSGFSYEKNLQEHILRVAGMNNSGVIHNNEIVVNRAMGYVTTGNEYQNAMPVSNHDIFLGAASIYSTAQDLLRFDQALYGNQLLGPELKQQMFTMVQPPYGYGWFVSESASLGKIISHGGDIFGFTSLIERRLKNKTLIVILGNLQSIDREKIVSILDEALK